jgi:tetratricopeptide (TPR) repeat protein
MKDKILYKLCALMLASEKTQIVIDDLYEDPEIGHLVRNIQIDSPFQELIFSGIISVVNKGNELLICFAVEGYFHYAMSRYLYTIDHDGTIFKTTDKLYNNKLKGINDAVAFYLEIFIQKGINDFIPRFIDRYPNWTRASARALAQDIISNGVGLTEKILKDKSNSDIVVLTMVMEYFEYINKPLPNQQLAHSIINILSPENINEYGLISECIKYVEQETLEIFYNRYLLFTEESHEKNDNFIKISYKIGVNLGKEILKYTYKDKALIIYNYNYQLTLNNKKFTKENLWLLGLIGQLKKSMGNTIDAIIDYKKAIEGLFEENEPFAAAQNQLRLSEIYKQEDKLIDALTIAIKSLQIIKSESGLVHLVTATAMSYIGSIYIYMEDWAQAEDYVKTSMTIREKLMGDNSTKVCINYVNYASVLSNTQRTEEAEKYLNKALEIRSGKFGENHQDVASTLFEKGNLYYLTNRANEAVVIHQKALEIRKNKLGHAHYFTIKSMLKLFEIYTSLLLTIEANNMEQNINDSLVNLKANKDAIINELNKIKAN